MKFKRDSVILTIKLSKEQAEKLQEGIETGYFNVYDIIGYGIVGRQKVEDNGRVKKQTRFSKTWYNNK